MEDFVIYEKPTCSKCRAAVALLDASGRPFRRVRYYEKPLSASKLRDLIKKSGLPAGEFVRANEPTFKALGHQLDSFSLKQITELLADNPDLIQRPILECGARATLGRPTDRAAAFIAACGQ